MIEEMPCAYKMVEQGNGEVWGVRWEGKPFGLHCSYSFRQTDIKEDNMAPYHINNDFKDIIY